MNSKSLNGVDSYIQDHPEAIQKKLKELRKIIQLAAPGAEERIGYGMPGYYLNGSLVYFAAWKNHIGFYGASSTLTKQFEKELKDYKISKGTIQIPYEKPIPKDLLTKLIKFRVKENLSKVKTQKK